MAHNADPNSYDMHASISGSRLVIYPYTQATDCWLFQNPTLRTSRWRSTAPSPIAPWRA